LAALRPEKAARQHTITPLPPNGDCHLPIANYRSRVADCRVAIEEVQIWIQDFKLAIGNRQSAMTNLTSTAHIPS
jgi:hypothetical protein